MHLGSIRSFTLLILLSFLSLSALTVPVRTQASSEEEPLPGEVVVKLIRADALPAVAADYGLDPAPIDRLGSQPIYRLRIVDGASPEDKADALILDPQGRVTYAEPNRLGQAPEGDGRVLYAGGRSRGDYVAQWAPGLIRLPAAHAITRGAGVTVAVLDTGADLSHPAFAGKLLPGYDFVDNDSDPMEMGTYGLNAMYGHGTHVAGLVSLVAPEAKILPLRVLDPDGFGDAWVVAKALAYSMDPDGDPSTDDGVDVINLSLGSPGRSSLLRDVIKAVACNDKQDRSPNDLPCFSPSGRGAVVIAAAGNGGSSEREYPAGDGLKGTLAVGASTRFDTLAAFSNYGSWVGVAAPGEDILSSVPGGEYGSWSGTSMATPIVAGEAALVRALYPSLKTAKVVQRIIDNSVNIGGRVRSRIDAAAALGLGALN
ncbi:MAG TPA: S8 family serine peptidase [Blastocatellia bacterium]|jgi:subtilisin family serine protease|nr:S8 family serine peptidase [Blastocatellia bacterium]